MKKLLLLVLSFLALGLSFATGQTAVPAPSEIPGSVQAPRPTTFAVVIEVQGALPGPAVFDQAQDWATRLMEAKGWVLSASAAEADCLATVMIGTDGRWRIILHLNRDLGSLPADAAAVAGDDSVLGAAPDGTYADDGSFDDVPDWCYAPDLSFGYGAPAWFFWPHPGREALRYPRVRDRLRPPAASIRGLPTERRSFSPAGAAEYSGPNPQWRLSSVPRTARRGAIVLSAAGARAAPASPSPSSGRSR